MRAVIYDEFGAPPALVEVADPVCPVDGVVIAVLATGVCRSDWHAWIGHDDEVLLPHVPGHEFAGVVAELGPDVRGWAIGDVVTVPFVCACGVCAPCRAGDHQVCLNQYQPGFTGWGSYAERVAIPRADLNLVRVPAGMDPAVAAGLGCRFSTAYRAVTAQGRVSEGQWLAVHGCGGVGLAAVTIAKSRGARVVAIDIAEPALIAARGLGADLVVSSATVDDVGAEVRRLTGGGVDVSIDAFGSAMTCANSMMSLRPRGRHVQVGLLLSPDGMTGVPMGAVVSRELEIVGSHGMSAMAFPAMLADIAAGRIDPSALIGRTISLDEAPAALMAMSAPEGTGGTTIVDLRIGAAG